jgi:hypothetical protein
MEINKQYISETDGFIYTCVAKTKGISLLYAASTDLYQLVRPQAERLYKEMSPDVYKIRGYIYFNASLETYVCFKPTRFATTPIEFWITEEQYRSHPHKDELEIIEKVKQE